MSVPVYPSPFQSQRIVNSFLIMVILFNYRYQNIYTCCEHPDIIMQLQDWPIQIILYRERSPTNWVLNRIFGIRCSFVLPDTIKISPINRRRGMSSSGNLAVDRNDENPIPPTTAPLRVKGIVRFDFSPVRRQYSRSLEPTEGKSSGIRITSP